MTDSQLSTNDDRGKLGYVWQCLTLACFHSNGLIVTKLARSYGDKVMLAYVQSIYRKEREAQVELLTRQKCSGAKLVDQMANTASGGFSSTAAMREGATEAKLISKH
jgi:isocitrate lyase